MPLAVREALRVKPRQQLEWLIQDDGTVQVRPQPRAFDLFASLKPVKRFAGTKQEKEAVRWFVAEQAAKEGLK